MQHFLQQSYVITQPQVNSAYLAELEGEKERLEAASNNSQEENNSTHLLRLLENGNLLAKGIERLNCFFYIEISHIQSGGGRSSSQREHIKYFDIYRFCFNILSIIIIEYID